MSTSEEHEEELNNIVDKVSSGNLDNADLEVIEEQLEENEEISTADTKRMFEDLANLRYNYALEMISKNLIAYVVRPKSSAEKAYRDYKKAYSLIKFLLIETRKAINEEQEEKYED